MILLRIWGAKEKYAQTTWRASIFDVKMKASIFYTSLASGGGGGGFWPQTVF